MRSRRVTGLVGVIGALGLGAAISATAVSSGVGDPVYRWNDAGCAIGAGCPGSLRFSFDPAARQIHDLSGLSPATGSCPNDQGGSQIYHGSFFSLKQGIPVAADGAFSYHGPFDANPNEPTKIPVVLDIDGVLGSDGTATGTYHESATYTNVPSIPCTIEGTAAFTATGPPLASRQNHAPVANADRVPAARWWAPLDVLANDTDADGDSLTVVRVEPMRCGRLVVGADNGTVAFEPPLKGCPRRQRGVYVASDGTSESNRASVFTPVVPAHLATGTATRNAQATATRACFHNTVMVPVHHKGKRVAEHTMHFSWCSRKNAKGRWVLDHEKPWTQTLKPKPSSLKYDRPTEVTRYRGFSDSVSIHLKWSRVLGDDRGFLTYDVAFSADSNHIDATDPNGTMNADGAIDVG